MSNTPKTKPSSATLAQEARDANTRPGVQESDETGAAPVADAAVDDDVAEHYEEMMERGVSQRGEGRIP